MDKSKHFDPIVAEWAIFTTGHRHNLSEKCLKLAQLTEYPDLDIDGYIQKINRLGVSLKEATGGISDPAHLINELNRHLFVNMGFGGVNSIEDTQEQDIPQRIDLLHNTIDKKWRTPVSMSVLYAEVAKFTGLNIELITMSGFILVRCTTTNIILNPLDNGMSVDDKKLQHMLDHRYGKGTIHLSPKLFRVINNNEILRKMICSVKESYVRSLLYDKALRCTKMALVLMPDLAEEIRDLGILEGRLKYKEAALEHLGRYLDMRPDAPDVSRILEVIDEIKTTSR